MLCLQATFKSDYMALVTAAGTAMTELLCTKQTLSEVRVQGLAQTPLHVPACHFLVLLCHCPESPDKTLKAPSHNRLKAAPKTHTEFGLLTYCSAGAAGQCSHGEGPRQLVISRSRGVSTAQQPEGTGAALQGNGCGKPLEAC